MNHVRYGLRVADLLRSPDPVVMGVLNVTPDSFSDGGRYFSTDAGGGLAAAVEHGVAMHRDGAHLVDVGGESTRPGAERVDPETEAARVLPVIRELAALGVPMSIDTTRASVAAAALEAGAIVVNDVSGGLADPDMAKVVAGAGCPWVLMHWRGHSRRMADLANYGDVVKEVRDELSQRVDDALAAGVAADRIVIDPGLGFAKNAEHNWAAHRPAAGADRARLSGAVRREPQVLPRPAAGRAGRHAPPGRPAHGRHRRDQRARGRRRCLGRAGARRAGDHRRDRRVAGQRATRGWRNREEKHDD